MVRNESLFRFLFLATVQISLHRHLGKSRTIEANTTCCLTRPSHLINVQFIGAEHVATNAQKLWSASMSACHTALCIPPALLHSTLGPQNNKMWPLALSHLQYMCGN